MHYDTALRNHGLKHDPFKALVVPRPVGWVATQDKAGVPNLAPYSFFNAVSDRPPMVMFSSGGYKDSLRNIEDTGEFTCSIASFELRDAMNLSSANVKPGVDEFVLAGLDAAPSSLVRPPRVARAPAALECKLWKTLPMPGTKPGSVGTYTVVFGHVVGVYIADEFIKQGLVDTGAMRALARLGYMDYAVITPESMFTLNRPLATEDGLSAQAAPGAWNGVYR